MKIGIIGIGGIGGALARGLAKAGHELRLANSRGPDAARALADEIGATPTDVHGAVADVDAAIVAIPFLAVALLPKGLFDRLSPEVPILDTSNYYPGARDPRVAEVDAGEPESLWVSRQYGRPVVKVFNNIADYTLADETRPTVGPDRFALTLAGDDPVHLATAARIVEDMGFDPVVIGGLAESWRVQPGNPAYVGPYRRAELTDQVAAAMRGKGETNRDYFVANFAELLGTDPDRDQVVDLQRRINAH